MNPAAAQYWSNIATIFAGSASALTVLLLLISVRIAITQIRRAASVQKRATASQLWDSYLARAIQYPMFAYPPNFIGDFDFGKREFKGSKEEFERYEWFVSVLLRATEEIFAELGEDKHRIATALHDVDFHQTYFKERRKWKVKHDYLDKLSDRLRAHIKGLCDKADIER